MKVLKIIGVIIIIIVAGAYLIPSKVRVERTETINAPVSTVFNQVNTLRNWEKWSPWGESDTTIYGTGYSGPESGVGNKHCWDSENEDVGKGCLTIELSEENKAIGTLLEFEGMSPGHGSWKFEETDGATNVTWAMEMDMGMNPVSRYFGLLMDGMIGPDFEKGLTNLKKVAENMPEEPKTYNGYMIKEVDFGFRTYFTKRAQISVSEIEAFYGQNLPVIYEAVGKAGLQPGSPSGIFYSYNEETQMTDMAAAVPVMGNEITEIEGLEKVEASGKALLIEYYGGYDKSANAHYAMDTYIKEKGLESNELVIEEYITDPGTEADTTKWLTNIYYLVK